MSIPLLEIQPRELKFIVELKKQSSCSVRLTNNTDHFVAFKVKTTSPKKYCVRPNVGVIKPRALCEFTVIMQAFKEAPPDMVCKDKFLIQSTIVPVGTTDESITAGMFSKGEGRHIEESKLRVSLVSPPHSPVLSPINRTLKQGPIYQDSMLKAKLYGRPEIVSPPEMEDNFGKDNKMFHYDELKPVKDIDDNNGLKPVKKVEPQTRRTMGFTENLKQVNDVKPVRDVISCDDTEIRKDIESKPSMLVKETDDDKDIKALKNGDWQTKKDYAFTEDIRPGSAVKPVKNVIGGEELKLMKNTEFKPMNTENGSAMPMVEQKLVKDIEEMKSKLSELEAKLKVADSTISKLTEERKSSYQERQVLQEELAALRTQTVVKQVHVGFPLLFVVAVAIISVALGYRMHT